MSKALTSAALFNELRKLIPDLPKRATEVTISLKRNDLPRVEVVFWPEAPDANHWPPGDPITKRFLLAEVESLPADPGPRTAHPQPGPSA